MFRIASQFLGQVVRVQIDRQGSRHLIHGFTYLLLGCALQGGDIQLSHLHQRRSHI
jgi:hypothetical protein